MTARQLLIIGHVQGVWFRASAKEKADELGVTGWARNRDDGSVEIHAEGSGKALRKFKEWCWHGPPAADVRTVEVTEAAEEGYQSFDIR